MAIAGFPTKVGLRQYMHSNFQATPLRAIHATQLPTQVARSRPVSNKLVQLLRGAEVKAKHPRVCQKVLGGLCFNMVWANPK